MSEIPEFLSKPITDAVAQKKRTPRPKKSAPSNSQGINRAITSIYKDDNGHLPNMKKIQIKKRHPIVKFFFTLLILGGLLAATAWVGFFVLPSSNKFSESNLDFAIAGPSNLILGATSTYTITIHNNQNVSLQNTSLNIRYPAGFLFLESSIPPQNAGKNEWSLGEISNSKKTILTIIGKSYGIQNEAQSWRVLLNYQPANFNSELQKTVILNTKIGSSPISVVATGPDKTTVGTEVEYTFQIENKSNWQPKQLELALSLPSNFTLTTSTPALNKNHWLINLSPTSALSDLKLTIRGKFSESAEENPTLKYTLYLPITELDQNIAIAENNLTTALTKNAVSFAAAINGSLKDFSTQPGETLNVTLNIKNTSATDITKANVKCTLIGPAIGKQTLADWKAITDPADGDIEGKQITADLRQGQIFWNNKKISALDKIKPGEEVNIDFKLPLKNSDQITLSDLKENKITITTEFNYTDANGDEQTLTGTPFNLNINSDLTLEIRHTTTLDKHDIKWIINNNFHPLKNIKLTASAYGDVSWQNEQTPAGEIKFDVNTKNITWTISEMPLSVDVLALPFSLTLNKKDPTQNVLVGAVHVTAEDVLTGQTIDFTGNEISLLK
ncbi:MAG: hypothetical protein WCX97_02460 [Candidatus Magasanikbacteria bacterium]